jgi:hypothetical protein
MPHLGGARDPSDVRVLERTREPQAVGQHSIHPAVGDKDGAGRGHRDAADGQAMTSYPTGATSVEGELFSALNSR